MAKISQKDTIIQYSANGVQSVYTFAFYLPEDGDLNVYVTPINEDPIPAEDLKVLATDYTVSFLVGNQGGYITFLPGKIPELGSTVTIVRDVKASLDVEFSNATTLNGENLDEAFERLLLMIQQNKTLIQSDEQRVLSYRINAFESNENIVANTQIPVLGANQIWKGTGTGVSATTLVEGADWSTLRSDLENNNPSTDGAGIVGYYDAVTATPTTVQAFLANLIPFLDTQLNATLMKPGMLIDYAGTTAPDGFLLCNGAAVSRTTYADLYAAIGSTWGDGNGSTTFTLPDLRRRTTIGSGGAATTSPPGIGNTVGNYGGEETHVLTKAEMPAHDHAGSYINGHDGDGGTVQDIRTGSFVDTNKIYVTMTSEGDDAAHNIMQKSAVVMKIIKY